MSKIRKLYWFDKKNTDEMISFLNNRASDTYISHIMFSPFAPLHHLLPLKFKFLPESYILEENKNIKGLITVAPVRRNQSKIEIQKLFFEENAYSEAAELVQYVVSRYKAQGAFSILVKVDSYLPDLLSTFVSKCGFSQISYEKLWKVNQFVEKDFNKKDFRIFHNSDSKAVANLYNDSLLPHLRILLNKETKEYRENIFNGLSYFSEYKYVIEDKKTAGVVGCIVIRTYDNQNFVVEIIQTNGVELDIDSILAYVYYQIRKRKKRFALFVRTKRYTYMGEKYEQYFSKKGYECVQNQILLTNSSARVIKEQSKSGKYTVIGDFCSSNIMPV